MKVAINTINRGIELSDLAIKRLIELGHPKAFLNMVDEPCFDDDCELADRTDKLLLQVIDELGNNVNGGHCKIKIVEVPDDVECEISSSDDMSIDAHEFVEEVHRWWS